LEPNLTFFISQSDLFLLAFSLLQIRGEHTKSDLFSPNQGFQIRGFRSKSDFFGFR
jgi:hypothetical protein